MGRWVTTHQGNKFYILDEGEENPYAKQIDKEISDKERQIAASRTQAEQANKRESFVISEEAAAKQLAREDEKYEMKKLRKQAETKASQIIPYDMTYDQIANELKSRGLFDKFKNKMSLRGSIGKRYSEVARAVLAEDILKSSRK